MKGCSSKEGQTEGAPADDEGEQEEEEEGFSVIMNDGGAAGISAPTPVAHPLIGLKIDGGLRLSKFGWAPQWVFGPQVPGDDPGVQQK